MAVVRVRLSELPPLTEEQKTRLRALNDFDDPMDDPDCPPTPDHILKRNSMLRKKYNTRRITKEILIAEGYIKPKTE